MGWNRRRCFSPSQPEQGLVAIYFLIFWFSSVSGEAPLSAAAAAGWTGGCLFQVFGCVPKDTLNTYMDVMSIPYDFFANDCQVCRVCAPVFCKKNTHDSNQILQVIFKITSRITRQCSHQQLNYFYFLFLPLAGVNITAKARSIL